jgi:hypothetical protein
MGEHKKTTPVADFWWYVVLKGGVMFGLLVVMPLNIVLDVFHTATTGTWPRDYNPITAARASQWTNIGFVLERALSYFLLGILIGLVWWVAHIIQTRNLHKRFK